mmetsp:Transcript_22036/g.72640  ORF Transcript_22036/g.72640 Transcript_22036/m.72640 type:complete len:201 (+) Transcript_22036:343-945(+)
MASSPPHRLLVLRASGPQPDGPAPPQLLERRALIVLLDHAGHPGQESHRWPSHRGDRLSFLHAPAPPRGRDETWPCNLHLPLVLRISACSPWVSANAGGPHEEERRHHRHLSVLLHHSLWGLRFLRVPAHGTAPNHYLDTLVLQHDGLSRLQRDVLSCLSMAHLPLSRRWSLRLYQNVWFMDHLSPSTELHSSCTCKFST